MDFDLSDEQRLLKDSVERLLADRCGDLKQRDAARAESGGWSKANWQAMADLGLLGIPFAEQDGGLGAGPVETMIVCEAIGRTLAVEPYISAIVQGGGILRHARSQTHKEAVLPRLIAGDLTLAFAHAERQSRWNLADVATTARQRPDGSWLIEGEKTVVPYGDSADKVIVSARVSGDRFDREGLALFLIDGNSDDLTRRGYPTQDGLRAADIALSGVRVPAEAVLGEPGQAFATISCVADETIAAVCAEAVGAMSALHELTVDYLKTRTQFGVPIGSFQVLQHRAVDMFGHLEQARSMALYATMMADEPDALERGKAVSAAKVRIGRSARFIGEAATQLHGGIGMTMEYKGGHYYKRLVMIDLTLGDAGHHLRELTRAGGIG